jgi:hypothetical protein
MVLETPRLLKAETINSGTFAVPTSQSLVGQEMNGQFAKGFADSLGFSKIWPSACDVRFPSALHLLF